MPGPPVHVKVEQSDAGPTLLVSGELDHDTVPDVMPAILDHFGPGVGAIRIDLAAVSFCDSSGLGLFVRLQRRAEQLGIDLTFCNPSPILKATFAVTRLDERLQVRRGSDA